MPRAETRGFASLEAVSDAEVDDWVDAKWLDVVIDFLDLGGLVDIECGEGRDGLAVSLRVTSAAVGVNREIEFGSSGEGGSDFYGEGQVTSGTRNRVSPAEGDGGGNFVAIGNGGIAAQWVGRAAEIVSVVQGNGLVGGHRGKGLYVELVVHGYASAEAKTSAKRIDIIAGAEVAKTDIGVVADAILIDGLSIIEEMTIHAEVGAAGDGGNQFRPDAESARSDSDGYFGKGASGHDRSRGS